MIVRNAVARVTKATRQPIFFRTITSSLVHANASEAAAPAEAVTDAPAKIISSCPEGTVLNGLNYFSGKQDPVALPDETYPAWLWKCLEVKERVQDESEDFAAVEFSKSKKQRRIASKKSRQLEADLLASGDLSHLVPKIPLHEQSINLPGKENGTFEENMEAARKRMELQRAIHKDRKAKIKEANYLNTM